LVHQPIYASAAGDIEEEAGVAVACIIIEEPNGHVLDGYDGEAKLGGQTKAVL
jgi:hypothetical protein